MRLCGQWEVAGGVDRRPAPYWPVPAAATDGHGATPPVTRLTLSFLDAKQPIDANVA